MQTLLLTLAILIGFPLFLIVLISLGQRSDYKKNKNKKETYEQYCSRTYARYV